MTGGVVLVEWAARSLDSLGFLLGVTACVVSAIVSRVMVLLLHRVLVSQEGPRKIALTGTCIS